VFIKLSLIIYLGAVDLWRNYLQSRAETTTEERTFDGVKLSVVRFVRGFGAIEINNEWTL
jgi:hypothetical protein